MRYNYITSHYFYIIILLDKCSCFWYTGNGDNMYSYIKGMVTEIGSGYIVVDNNGIGYLIAVAMPEKYRINEQYTVFVYQHVREDEQSLYGFQTKEEKDLFLRLINVKGVGCKMALGMFTGSIEGIIDAIERENILYLKKFPKVGEKVARQIILDLKGKLVANCTKEVIDNSELVEALKALGYKIQSINKVIPLIHTDEPIEKQIREALKLL